MNEELEQDKSISDTDAERVVFTIKKGSVEDGIIILQTLIEKAQDKIIDEVRRQLKNGKS